MVATELRWRVDGGDVAASRMVKPSAALSAGIAAIWYQSDDNGGVDSTVTVDRVI